MFERKRVNLPKVEQLQLSSERSSGSGFVELLTPKVPLSGRPVGDVTREIQIMYNLLKYIFHISLTAKKRGAKKLLG